MEQITSGETHHFFGYIGQCRTIPWSGDGRYIVGLEVDRIDRMPAPADAARVILVDTQRHNAIVRLDTTRAWNPQQGAMLYWNPRAPDTQFFFNDRNISTGRVFAVLYDIAERRRLHEFRYEDTPIGNSGVAQQGGAFLGLNYGRLARLRLVTGYPGALDWSQDATAPENDGLFLVDVRTGNKQLLVSYQALAQHLQRSGDAAAGTDLFINHTLWNRAGDRIYFFVRAGWNGSGTKRIDVPCSIRSDGTQLMLHRTHIGGHPEWAEGGLLIGRRGKDQVVYDVDRQEIVATLGSREVFPNPEGDIALSPSGEWLANGYSAGSKNYYVVFRRSDGAFTRSEGLDKGSYRGDIRIDAAPCWNRTDDAILASGIAANGTRQMYVIRLIAAAGTSLTSPAKIHP